MAFAAAEVEDGTGKATALVYEQASAATAWLTHAARGLTALSSASATAQDEAMLAATNAVESWLSDRPLDGRRTVAAQALSYPRTGSTNRAGRTYPADEIPLDLLIAIRLLAEEHVSTPIVLVDSKEDREMISAPGASVKYRHGARGASYRYPEVWERVLRLYDPTLRREVWAA